MGVQRSIAVLQRDTKQYFRGGLKGRKRREDEIGLSLNAKSFSIDSVERTFSRDIHIKVVSSTAICD
jgi:hypothetical protein